LHFSPKVFLSQQSDDRPLSKESLLKKLPVPYVSDKRISASPWEILCILKLNQEKPSLSPILSPIQEVETNDKKTVENEKKLHTRLLDLKHNEISSGVFFGAG